MFMEVPHFIRNCVVLGNNLSQEGVPRKKKKTAGEEFSG